MVYLYWSVSLVVCFCCVLLSNGNEIGKLPEPVEPHLIWSGFCPILKWKRPTNTCRVNYTIKVEARDKSVVSHRTPKTEIRLGCVSREFDFHVEITTDPLDSCNMSSSRPVKVVESALPAVVKNFTCSYYSQQAVNCTWVPLEGVTGLQSYFGFDGNGVLQPCPVDLCQGSERIGCHLGFSQLSSTSLFFLINATSTPQGAPEKNMFMRDMHNSYKLLPPDVTIQLQDRKGKRDQILRFNWTRPNFTKPHCFIYNITLLECGIDKSPARSLEERNDYEMAYNPECLYSFRVKSDIKPSCGKGTSEPSKVHYYGQDRNSGILMAMMIVCLGLLLLLSALLYYLYHKYREKLLPKIPDPGQLKVLIVTPFTQERLYEPEREEVERCLEIYPMTHTH